MPPLAEFSREIRTEFYARRVSRLRQHQPISQGFALGLTAVVLCVLLAVVVFYRP
jgi:hypothetical protein